MNIKNSFKNEFKSIVIYLLVIMIIGTLPEYFLNAKMSLDIKAYYSFIYILISFLILNYIMLSFFIDYKSVTSDSINLMKKRHEKNIIYNIVAILFIFSYLLIAIIKNIEIEDMNGIYAFFLVTNNLIEFAKMLIIITKAQLKNLKK